MRRTHLLAVALAFASMFPATAFAVTVRPPQAPTPPPNGTVTYTYRTFLAPEPIAGGGPVGDLNEDFGTLHLTFNANGIISGTYHPDYGPPIPVTGGRTDPQHLWLELGGGPNSPHRRVHEPRVRRIEPGRSERSGVAALRGLRARLMRLRR
jgi:hypothetical protein